MTNFEQLYTNFLDENYITTYETLKNVLLTFPYYCKFIQLDLNHFKVKLSECSIQNDNEDDILNYIDNLVINKNNIKNYYFFSKTIFPIKMNQYKFNKNDKIIVENDYLKFYLFHDGKKWNISSGSYNNIYSLLEKIEFEPNTLGELFNKYITIYKVDLNKLNPSFNYVFGLTCFDTNLLMNEKSVSKLTLISITSKQNNKSIPVTIDRINSISRFLSYNKEINFSSKTSMMNFLDQNKEYKKIIINNNYIYFTHYRRFKRVLNELKNDPFKLIIRNHNEILFNELKTMFRGLNDYLTIYKTRIDMFVKYYYNLYRDEKILKKTDLVYQKYDKEIIMKIHNIYINSQVPIRESDILIVLGNLHKRKTDHIYRRLI